jgi:hypothetical protein
MALLYGILCFVLQIASRREANRELTGQWHSHIFAK